MAQNSTGRAWARGGMIFAATVMLIIGIFQILEGIAAIARNQFFVVSNGFDNYAYNLSTRSWGWIHLAVGILVGLTGFFLYTGVTWARAIGIVIVSISAIANFFFLPYYPLWSLLIIALDIFVIWSLASVGRERAMGSSAMQGSMGAAGSFGGEAPQEGERWPTAGQPAGKHWSGDTSQKEGVRDNARNAGDNVESRSASATGQSQRPPDYPQSGQSGQYPGNRQQ